MATEILVENGPWRSLEDVAVYKGGPSLNVIKTVDSANVHFKSSLGLRQSPIEIKQDLLGRHLIRARGVSGTFSSKIFSVNIAPKFVPQANIEDQWSSALLSLVRYSRKRDHVFSRSFNLEQSKPNLIDLLGMAYVDAVRDGLKDQLIQTYQMEEYSLPSIRGRLNIHRQIKSIYERPHLFECDVDQFNPNNTYNSLLKWGALVFSENVQSPLLRRNLLELSYRFPGVSNSQLAQQRKEVSPPPQYRSWQPALELCSMLYAGGNLTSGRSTKHGYSILFNMEKLFEQVIERVLKQAINYMALPDLHSKPQASMDYAIPLAVSTRKYFTKPDNVIGGPQGAIAVVDAKYKRLSDKEGGGNRKPQNPDFYELVAGMTAHKCDVGLLIYPKVHSEAVLNDEDLKVWQVEAFGKKLKIGSVALDLIKLKEKEGRDSLAQRIGEVLDQLLVM